MRRGSIQTWEPLARRQSSNMAQFSNSRSEFMTSDLGINDIEYERKGGFFMTHKKTALIISAVVVIIIAAGFVGAYIGSIPKEKAYDTLALIDGDVGCDYIEKSKFSLSDSLRPSRYRIELSPIVVNETISRLRGRVAIEFRYNASANLQEIVLNGRHLNVTRIKLISGTLEESGNFHFRRKRSGQNDETEIMRNLTAEERESLTNAPVNLVIPTTSNENRENRTLVGMPTIEQIESSNSNRTKIPELQVAIAEDSSNITTVANSTVPVSDESFTTESSVKNETREILIIKNEIDDKAGFMVFYPQKPIKSGEYYLEIEYEVPIDGYFIYATNKSENSSEKWMAANRIKPTNLRNLFPLFNGPRMKATFSLTLSRPATMKLYSNMPLRSTITSSNYWVMDTFEETPRISPSSLAVAATDHLETLGEKIIGDTTVNFWDENLQTSTANYLVEMIEPVIQTLTELFNVTLSIPKLDVIGLQNSDYSSGYPGLIMIKESLFDVKAESSEVTKEYALMNLIKLIGEQWLGGLVNTQNLSDIWILESSLLYLQHRLAKEINPAFNHSTFIMDVQPDVLENDGYSVSRSLRAKLDPTHSNSFYERESYGMGACLIRMLHGALRQAEFRAGYGTFVSRWSGDNADIESFWEAMIVNSTADEQPEVGANLLEIMKLWSNEGGYPVVTVTRNYKTGSAIVHQARFSYDKASSVSQQLWHIPLTWISNGNNQSSLKWIRNQAETTVEIETMSIPASINKTWVVFNPSKTGHYRVNYDLENWKLIADALRENHETFLPVTRASLIDDVFNFGFVRTIPYSVVFDVIQYLPENEREPEPWAYLLHHAIKLNLVLYDTPVYFEYQELMITFLTNMYHQVGPQINEGSRLTMIAHRLACLFDYPDYFAWAKKSYAGFESLPGLPITNETPSYLHDNLLCAFAKLEHELGWQWWQQKFANVTNREERNSLLSSLACFQVPSMLQAVLNEIVYSESFEENDALVVLKSFSIYPAAAQTALKFVESNWKNITRRYPKSCKIASAFLDASSTGFTGEKDIEDFQSFRSKNYDSLKKVGYVTALLEAKANATVSFLISLPDHPLSKINGTTFWDTNIEKHPMHW